MVRFAAGVAERTKRQMQYQKEHEAELPPRTVTVRVEKEDDYLSMATRPGSDLTWYSDEAKERGGSGKGPSPLAYFLSSMGFCQFVHYAEHSITRGIRLDSLRMKIDGKVVAQRPRRFSEVSYEVSITSKESDDTIRDLALRAVEDCYVTNTLRRAIPVTGTVIHNGKKIDEHPGVLVSRDR